MGIKWKLIYQLLVARMNTGVVLQKMLGEN